MVELLDFRQEARGCLRLAETEEQPEVKTILMGMALGWLTLAHQERSSDPLYEEAEAEEDAGEEWVEPTTLDTLDEPA